MKLKQITASLVAATMFASNPVFAQAGAKVSGEVVKIGVLTDLSSTYSDLAGPGAVIAAKMAIADFSKDGTVIGKKIELVSADHQNKADIAANKAREWYDKEKVDVITELVSTNAAVLPMWSLSQTPASIPSSPEIPPIFVRWVLLLRSISALALVRGK